MKCSFLILLLLGVTALSAQSPKIEKQFEWFQKNHIIQTVTFNPEGDGLAFVRRLQPADSLTKSPAVEDRSTENLLPEKGNEKRLKDPVVALLKMADRQLKLVDYGWTPRFSPNGNRLVYTHQKQPLDGSKIVASTFKGNDIRIFTIQKKQSDVVVPTPRTFLMDPVFIDSLNVVYKTGDAVNGPYAGGISLHKYTINTKKTESIRGSRIQFRLYDLMGEVYGSGADFYYTLYSPQDSGLGMASEYSHLLMKGNDTLHNFGIRPYQNLEFRFAVLPQKEVIYIDDNHLIADDTSYIATYRNGKLESRKPLDFDFTKIYLSPDGRYILYITQEMEAFVLKISNFMKVQVPLPKKEIHSINWTHNGRQFSVVQDHSTLENTDALYIFKISD